MKIQLERKIATCADQLECVTCQQTFTVAKLRALLSNDAGWLEGDICPNCLQHSKNDIQQQLRAQAGNMLRQPEISLQQRGLELLVLSQENLTLPKWHDWARKWLEVLCQETQELEAARLGTACRCRQGRRVRIVFQED